MAAPIAAGMQENTAYLVQEYVAADSLDVVLRDQGPAPLGDALRVARQLADAVDAGVAHGGIHPRDVLLSAQDVRVTGFGIAPALEQVGVAAPLRRPYTAPERLAGAAWDRRADIFSIAAVMYEVLVGKRITGTGEAGVQGLNDVAGPQTPALVAIFGRALAENPADRFDSGSAFAQELAKAHSAGRRSERRHAPAQPVETTEETTPPLPLELPLQPVAAPKLEVPLPDPHPTPPLPVAALHAPEPVAPSSFSKPPVRSEPRKPLHVPPADRHVPQPPMLLSALDRSRSAIWPLALAFVVGVGLGIPFGFGLYPVMSVAPAGDVGPAAPATDGAAAEETAAAPVPQPVGEPPVVATPVESSDEVAKTQREAQPAPAPAPAIAVEPPARTTPRPAAPAPLPVYPGRLLVRSTPAGARVFVDGRDQGASPAEVRGLAPGVHTVQIIGDGFVTEERQVAITRDRPAQNLTIALTRAGSAAAAAIAPGRPAAASALRIESRPAGATIFLDGRLVGTTPMLLSGVAPGAHEVRMELEGYRTWSASTVVDALGDNRVTGSLER